MTLSVQVYKNAKGFCFISRLFKYKDHVVCKQSGCGLSFLTIALLSPFIAYLVSFFQFWRLNLGLTHARKALSYPLSSLVSKVTSSFLLIRIIFLGGRYQGTGGREEVEPVRAKVAICSFNWFPGSLLHFTVEWFCCVAAGPRIFFFWRKLWNWIFNRLIFNCVWNCVHTCEGSAHEVQKRALDPLGLVLQVAMSHPVCVLGTELHTWVLWKSNNCS